MNTAVATTQAFQERMFERIRDQMGDLLTNDDLKKLVDSAMERAFFTGTKDGYGREQTPPVFQKMIHDLMRERIAAVMGAWLKENEARIMPLIRDEIGKGMLGCAAGFFERSIQSHVYNFGQNIENSLRNSGVLR